MHRLRRLAERALFRANGGAPECLYQRWTRSREGPEKGESTGGFVEQAYNHRVRDVATWTNLRYLTIRIAFVP